VHSFAGHKFRLTTYNVPTECNVCHEQLRVNPETLGIEGFSCQSTRSTLTVAGGRR